MVWFLYWCENDKWKLTFSRRQSYSMRKELISTIFFYWFDSVKIIEWWRADFFNKVELRWAILSYFSFFLSCGHRHLCHHLPRWAWNKWALSLENCVILKTSLLVKMFDNVLAADLNLLLKRNRTIIRLLQSFGKLIYSCDIWWSKSQLNKWFNNFVLGWVNQKHNCKRRKDLPINY